MLADVFGMKVASMRSGDIDRLEVFLVIICSGFAKIATAQSDTMLKIWEANMLHRGCGIEDWKK